ncbi:MAG: homocysteine S-methyltransferase family protein [Clostridia bacterium]|nr:homocysteine S-methyltransferase family protein [Clostridia bacterium]
MSIKDQFGKSFIFFDGGFGTMLQKYGIKTGVQSIEMNTIEPETVQRIHREYLEAGANIITCNTFGCDRFHTTDKGIDMAELIEGAIKNARVAIGDRKDKYCFYDIGPCGKLLEPLGDLSFDDAYEVFAEQVRLADGKVDGFIAETMTDLYELKAAILAVRENSDLPLIASVSFSDNGKTLTGASPEQMVTTLEALGVDMLGINCSLGPRELMPIVKRITAVAAKPLLVQPNAGLPRFDGENTFYDIDADEYALYIGEMIEAGISGFGGCCGTTPDHIRKSIEESKKHEFKYDPKPYRTIVTGTSTMVEIGNRVIRCGERLNPTGKPKMKAAILEGRLYDIVDEGVKQIEKGADVLDVNVGIPNIDEEAVMVSLVKQLQEVIDVPLQIDSTDPKALEHACRIYNGIPLINSVNGKKEIMDNVFPIAAKYGGVLIGLCIDEDGIPPTAEERFKIAENIVKEAAKYGIRKERLIIDSLVLTASAQQKEVMETVKCVKYVTDRLGCSTCLGLSNVSFGLPNRPLINRTFIVMAMLAGLKLPILNPFDRELMSAIDAFEVLNAKDENATDYIERHANDVTVAATSTAASAPAEGDSAKTEESSGDPLFDAIVKGQKHKAVEEASKLDKTPLEIVSDSLIPALDKVGNDYDKGKIFLPQLMVSAETAKLVFDEIRKNIKTDSSSTKGPIVIATVEADVHDIGKNIVKVVLQSYGFEVIDLGKDVKASVICDAVREHKPIAVGLSALMTTTVVYMRKTIEALKEQGLDVPTFVGGAVLTQDVADQIGATYYAKDAMESVRICEQINDEVTK